MKGNKGLYILLPIVAIVWGLIAYRVVKYVGQSNTLTPTLPVTEIKFEPEKFEADTFSILANYADPFEADMHLASSSSIAIPHIPTVNQPVQTQAEKQSEPTVLYNGMISNKKWKRTFALLKVNGKQNLLMINETANNIKLLKISPDSIIVLSSGKKRTILLSKKAM